MKTHRLVLALTLVNLTLLTFQIVHLRAAEASPALGILRGTGLEIVDDQGRGRAQIVVYPGDDSVTLPNGQKLKETVLFRLSTADGKPRVKIGTSEQGAGLSFVGDSDDTYLILQADLEESTLKLKDGDGTEKLISTATAK